MISQMWQESRRLDCINTQGFSYPTLLIFNDSRTAAKITICMWMTRYPWQNRGWRQQKWQQLTLAVQSSQSCPTLRGRVDCGTPGFLSFTSSRACSHSCSWSQWRHLLIAVVSFCPQSVPASGSFPMSGLLTSGGKGLQLQSFQRILRDDFL